MKQYFKYTAIASIICLLTFMYTSVLFAGSIKLSWTPPTENMDGTPLTDLSGYKIYYGTEPNLYTESLNVGSVTNYWVSQLENGNTYYFTVIAYDRSGNESPASNEVSLAVYSSGKKPSPPRKVRLSKQTH